MNHGKEQAIVELLYKAKTRAEIDYLVDQLKGLRLKGIAGDKTELESLPDIQVKPYGDSSLWYNRNCGKCVMRCKHEEDMALCYLTSQVSLQAVVYIGFHANKPLNEYVENDSVKLERNCKHKARL
jgi:aldehyde:ferredoxin oxidoreductase